MRDFVSAYFVKADAIKSLFGSRDAALHEQIVAHIYKKYTDAEADAIEFSILRDLIFNGEIRFPKEKEEYGYVYMLICEYFSGELLPAFDDTDGYLMGCVEEYYDRNSLFIDIPSSPRDHTIYSIPFKNLKEDKMKLLNFEKLDGYTDEERNAALKKIEFIYDKAIEEKNDLVLFCGDYE
jgi:hypothetical protein